MVLVSAPLRTDNPPPSPYTLGVYIFGVHFTFKEKLFFCWEVQGVLTPPISGPTTKKMLSSRGFSVAGQTSLALRTRGTWTSPLFPLPIVEWTNTTACVCGNIYISRLEFPFARSHCEVWTRSLEDSDPGGEGDRLRACRRPQEVRRVQARPKGSVFNRFYSGAIVEFCINFVILPLHNTINGHL